VGCSLPQLRNADTLARANRRTLLRAAHDCATQGNPGALGDAGAIPQFSRDAFALLGFDEGIDDYCRSRAPFGYKDFLHAERCVAANVNILSLYGVSMLAAAERVDAL
jgi:hypothetical protein